MRVLLVDDDRMALDGLERMVDWASVGADVIGKAENGEEALRIARSNYPDVIITDISMPVMDGLELAREVSETMDGVSIFLISGHDDFEYAQRAIRYGVKNYILKPINRRTIVSLTEMLQKISREQTVKEEQYRKLWNGLHAEELRLALNNGDEEFFDRIFSEISKDCTLCPDVTVTLCIRLLQALYRYLEEIQMQHEAVESSYQNSVEEMLALRDRNAKQDFVFQKYYDVLGVVGQQKGQSQNSIAFTAKKLVDKGFTSPDLNVAALAGRTHCSPTYLSTVFRQSVGVSLSGYIGSLRLEYAKKLLSERDRSISNVAQEVGYVDSHYFTKLFKKKTGLTPSEYRNLTTQSGAVV